KDQRGSLLEGQGVVADYRGALFDQELGSIHTRTGRGVALIQIRVLSKEPSPACPNEHGVAALEFYPLRFCCVGQMSRRDLEVGRQRRRASLYEASNIQEHTTIDQTIGWIMRDVERSEERRVGKEGTSWGGGGRTGDAGVRG